MCTVLLRFRPGDRWPLLLGAVRDEFRGRAWDPPAAHWGDRAVQGGRDRQAGGTWLAVDRARGVVSALLNGERRPAPLDGRPRPTRGTLALAALRHSPTRALRTGDPLGVAFDAPRYRPAGGVDSGGPRGRAWDSPAGVPHGDDGPVPGIPTRRLLADYDGFHLVRADPERVDVWSWDGAELDHVVLGPGDHIVVNLGVDREDDPLVPYFRPRLAALAGPAPEPGLSTDDAWGDWVTLLRGGDLGLTDPRALIIDHEIAGGHYGSTSASLVGIRTDRAVRYDFTGDPRDPRWSEIPADLL